jgi:ribonuclease HII
VRTGNTLFNFDLALCGRGRLAGADEAGRGSLAGPLVAAAVCLDYSRLTRDDYGALVRLNDSKKLPRSQRDLLYAEIIRRADQVSVISCSQRTIDRRGLHRCNLAALGAALDSIAPPPDLTLVDGFALPHAPLHRHLVGGDARSAVIAAASIVAKVTRDRLMIGLHERYPLYGFDRHVGYSSPQHRDTLAAYGPCELHRLSFAGVEQGQLELGLTPEDARE